MENCINYLVYEGYHRNHSNINSTVTQVQYCSSHRMKFPREAPAYLCNSNTVSEYIRIPDLQLALVICGRR